MLYCGTEIDRWVEKALSFLPDDILDKIDGKIAFTVLKSNACRLAKKICDHEEIILLSPWIWSYIPAGSCETAKEMRYFIFCILHEIAHAVLKHLPPDEISMRQNTDQEDEANKYALEWFNNYALEHRDEGLVDFTLREKEETEDRYEKKLEEILSCG